MKRGALLMALLVLLCGCHRQRAVRRALPAPVPPTAPAQVADAASASDEEPIVASVPEYHVSDTFAEVSNYAEFAHALPLSDRQKALLRANLFVCSPSNAVQLHHIYEENDYLNIPSFISTDCVLHLYHIFFDYTLRNVEKKSLLPILERLSRGMLAESLRTMQEAPGGKLRSAAQRNAAFFTVALQALGVKASVPASVAQMAAVEEKLIAAHGGFAKGAIFPYRVDYSQFVVRGHYTRTPALRRYFTSMMWYGLMPFAVYRGNHLRNDEQVLQGILLARSLMRAGLMADWQAIYEPTAFLVGTADDHTPAEWQAVSDQTFGPSASIASYADPAALSRFVSAVEKLRQPRIKPEIVTVPDMPAPWPQLRVMGQRYLPDSEVLQRVSFPLTRPMPSGLDVMAALGSARAAQIMDERPEVYNPGHEARYVPERSKVAAELAALPADSWKSNLYRGWLRVLQAQMEPVAEGFPSFMRNQAWQDRCLSTALGSWAELRHDTILYGKQSAVECGDGEDRPRVYGYVEPNARLYARMLDLTQRTREGLEKRGFLTPNLKTRFEQLTELVTFLHRVSLKELRNEALTDDEYEQIRMIGGQMESLIVSIAEGEILSDTDKDMAVIADVHTSLPNVLEAAVGRAQEILVIVPVRGKLELTRGAVFQYYEFPHAMSDRLTDERWQAYLRARKTPPAPPWYGSFTAPSPRTHKPVKDLLGFSSGC